MTRATFFKHFDLLADQPDAVAKMRELVLNLAVRGKLVAQNPKDESAEILLSKVLAAKERLTRESRIKELAADLPIGEEDKNRALPHGWAWAKLADLCIKLGAGSTPLGGKQVYETSGVKFLRSQNVYNDGLHLDDAAFIPPAIHKDMSGTWVQPGDILLNITGASIGRSAIVPDDFDEANVSQHVAIVRLAEKALRQFLHLVVIAPDFQQRIMDVQVGVSREGLSMTRLKEFVVAVPPLAEQRRIVGKVDELMALCDELEQRQQARQHASGLLQQSALHHLLAAREPQTFAAAWQRVRDHFHLLHDTPAAIPQLRQAILQLAVQGRLVPQNPKDGDGRKVVEQILRKRGNTLSANTADEFPSLPKSWAAISVQDIFEVVGGIQKTPLRAPRENAFPYLRVANVQRGRLVLDDVQKFELGDGELERWRLEPDDLLVVEGNGSEDEIGRCAQWHGEIRNCVHQNHIIRCRPFGHDASFVILFFNSPAGIEEMKRRAITTSGLYSLSVGKIRSLPIPFPPLAEQKRIVARVEELLRWCDTLEAQLHQTRTLGAHLLDSTLHRLLAA